MAEQSSQQVLVASQDSNFIESSLAVEYSKGEIDMQVSTAKKYPRVMTEVQNRITSLATLDKATTEECMYALPRAGKPIRGPSIRFAEIVKSQYGNCRAAARVIHVDRKEKVVIAEGVFHDLENNVATRAEVRRRIVDKNGKIFNDDMIIVTGNAAISIALRNAILGGVPRALWRKGYDAVERVLSGSIETLAVQRDKAVSAFAVWGIKPEQLYKLLDVQGVEDMQLDDIVNLRGVFTAIKNGETTVEEVFAPPPPAKTETPAETTKLEASASDIIDETEVETEKLTESAQEAQKGDGGAEVAEKVETPSTDAPEPAAKAKKAKPAETIDNETSEVTTADLDPETLPGKLFARLKDKLTWGAFETTAATIFQSKDFKDLESIDGHLSLYDAIKRLPIWEKADSGSAVYAKIKAGF